VKSDAATITVRLNDEPRTLSGAATLVALMAEMGLSDARGIAAAVNDAVIPRGAWETCALSDGDRVLVIRAAQGG